MILNLTEKTLSRYEDKEPVIITDDGLFVEIQSKYDLSRAVISLKNNEKRATIKYSRVIEIPRELLFTGRLFIVVELFENGKVVKKWQAEPLMLREHEATFEAEPWCIYIETRLAAIETNQDIIK